MSYRHKKPHSKTARLFDRFLALQDFEPAAKRRLPRPLFGYVQGGVESNQALRANRAALDALSFCTRILRDITQRSLKTKLLGESYALPIGIAPMGICALNAYRGDLVLANAAAAANIPMILSGASLIPLEQVQTANPSIWFQAYLTGQIDGINAMLDRVEKSGISTLVLTVDVPVRANRENNIRTGFSSPLRPSLRLAWDGLTRPIWLLDVLLKTLIRHGLPHFENSSDRRGPPVISSSAVREFEGRGTLTWDHVRMVRRRWRKKLVIKGVLSPQDAALAREHGADGIILSNHGGRQLDWAISPMAILPEVVQMAQEMPVMIDGGFQRGSDAIKALALGASFVFVGRPFMYALAVAGEAGVLHAIDLLEQELSRDMAMLGYTSIDQIDPECLRLANGSPVAPQSFANELRIQRSNDGGTSALGTYRALS